MKIKKATKEEEKAAIKIAAGLKDWFNKKGLENMKIDFQLNNLIVAKENNKVHGFLCYSSNSGKMLLIWMGVKQGLQRKGIGQKLLDWLEKEAKRLGLYSIEVETLPDEDDYRPYKQTRSFYYKNRFKRMFYKKATIEGWDDQVVFEKKI